RDVWISRFARACFKPLSLWRRFLRRQRGDRPSGDSRNEENHAFATAKAARCGPGGAFPSRAGPIQAIVRFASAPRRWGSLPRAIARTRWFAARLFAAREAVG